MLFNLGNKIDALQGLLAATDKDFRRDVEEVEDNCSDEIRHIETLLDILKKEFNEKKEEIEQMTKDDRLFVGHIEF